MFRERPVLSWVWEAASAVASPVALVVRETPPFVPPGAVLLYDTPGAEGPLGGISAALSWSPSARLLILAGDVPLVTPALLRALLAFDPSAPVVVPRVGEHIQPLCAVYQAALAPLASSLLQRGARAAQRLFWEAGGRAVPAEALGNPQDVARALAGVNTPGELAEAEGRDDE
jgi:molybdopterin-guanine dinucleotide biosynthesis protein A